MKKFAKKLGGALDLTFLVSLCMVTISTGYGQMVSRPAVYTSSNVADVVSVLPSTPGSTPPPTAAPGPVPNKQQAFSTGNVMIPTGNSSQFAASSRVYSLSVLGGAKCTPSGNGLQKTCVAHYLFTAAVDANVVNAVNDQATALREYLFSQNGSPISLSFPSRTWTTKKGDVRQSWLAGSLSGSGRLIPVTGTKSTVNQNSSNPINLTGGGSVSFGGTGQVNIEFDATEPGSDPNGTDTVYPGTLYFSISPSISALAGGPLKAAVFQGSPPSSWTWGGDFRAGFEFKGQKPISFGITGTFSGKGVTTSDKGVALSLSKLFGGSN